MREEGFAKIIIQKLIENNHNFIAFFVLFYTNIFKFNAMTEIYQYSRNNNWLLSLNSRASPHAHTSVRQLADYRFSFLYIFSIQLHYISHTTIRVYDVHQRVSQKTHTMTWHRKNAYEKKKKQKKKLCTIRLNKS